MTCPEDGLILGRFSAMPCGEEVEGPVDSRIVRYPLRIGSLFIFLVRAFVASARASAAWRCGS
jgi:hypothetical protein